MICVFAKSHWLKTEMHCFTSFFFFFLMQQVQSETDKRNAVSVPSCWKRGKTHQGFRKASLPRSPLDYCNRKISTASVWAQIRGQQSKGGNTQVGLCRKWGDTLILITSLLKRSGRFLDGLSGLARGRDLQVGGLHPPDLPGVLGDGSVARELPCRCNVLDHHLGPLLWILMNMINFKVQQKYFALAFSFCT